MQKRVELTVFVVFATLSCRTIFALMFASGFVRFDQRPDCLACEECQSELTAMVFWFIENPIFHAISIILSAPVALLIAMFGALISKPELDLLLFQQSSDFSGTSNDNRGNPIDETQ